MIEQLALFLHRLKDQELEDFLYIRRYLGERLTDYLNKAKHEFVHGYIKVGSKSSAFYRVASSLDVYFIG